MDTTDLRSLVKAAATGIPGARLWPNGLGFDWRGTQYRYLDRVGRWEASRPYGTYSTRYGEGSTPAEAKRAAGIGRMTP